VLGCDILNLFALIADRQGDLLCLVGQRHPYTINKRYADPSENSMATATAHPVQEVFPHPPTNLPTEDGVPLESDWHRLAMNLLIEMVTFHFQGRDDFFVGGNMFIYFDARQARDRHFRGPDFFFVWEATLNPPRPYWAIWDEG